MAVTQVGAIPVFVDPNERTFNIDPDRIESAISPKTKAIIPIHFFGQTCEMRVACLGAGVITSVAVAQGQNPLTALGITLFSAVAAVAVGQVL